MDNNRTNMEREVRLASLPFHRRRVMRNLLEVDECTRQGMKGGTGYKGQFRKERAKAIAQWAPLRAEAMVDYMSN